MSIPRSISRRTLTVVLAAVTAFALFAPLISRALDSAELGSTWSAYYETPGEEGNDTAYHWDVQSSIDAVAMLDASRGWAVGSWRRDTWNPLVGEYDPGTERGMVWTTTNGGSDWATATAPIPDTGTGHLRGVAVVAADDVWAVGDSGQIWHWVGASWTQYAPAVTSRALRAVDFQGSHGWAVGAWRTLLHYNGSAWITSTTTSTSGGPDFNDVVGIDSNTAVAVGQNEAETIGYIYRTVDGGTTWTQVGTSKPQAIYGVAVSPDRTTLMASAGNGKVYTSKDDGATWSEAGLPLVAGLGEEALRLRGVSLETSLSVVVVGDFGVVYRTENGGRKWELTRPFAGAWIDDSVKLSRVRHWPGSPGRIAISASNEGSGIGYIFDGTLTLGVPAAPTGLAVSDLSATSLRISWTDPSYSATGFLVQRKVGAEPFDDLVTVGPEVTSYDDTGLTPGETYTYRVRAINGTGSSSWSGEGIGIVAGVAPIAPSGLQVESSGLSVALTWTDTSNNEAGFHVWRQDVTAGESSASRVATVGVNVQAWTDPTAAPDSHYRYQVSSYNGVGESSTTAFQDGWTTPAAPTGLSVWPSGAALRLGWTDVARIETDYVVERTLATVPLFSGSAGVVATLPAGTTAWTDSATEPGVRYLYRVKAVNVAGDSAYSNEAGGVWLTATSISAPALSTSKPRRNKVLGFTSYVYPGAAAVTAASRLDLYRWESKRVWKIVRGKRRRVTVKYWRGRGSAYMYGDVSGRVTTAAKLRYTGKWLAVVTFQGSGAYHPSSSSRTFTVR